MAEPIHITTKKLNNKSRKGTYHYVRSGKHKGYYPTTKYTKQNILAYFKAAKIEGKNVSLQDYAQKKIKPQQKRKTQQHQKRKQKKYPPVNDTITKGITQTSIINTGEYNQHQEYHMKKELLKDLVKDEQILELLIKDENFKKLKNRLQHTLEFRDANQNALATVTAFGKTIQEVYKDIKEEVKIMEIADWSKNKVIEGLKRKKWYEDKARTPKTATHIKHTITFRKA